MPKIENQIIENGGRRWLVREAASMEDALNAIAHARVSGSVGHKDIVDSTRCGGSISTIADVVQVNSDGTERQPYTEAY